MLFKLTARTKHQLPKLDASYVLNPPVLTSLAFTLADVTKLAFRRQKLDSSDHYCDNDYEEYPSEQSFICG
jgi:hypothetical protein